MENELLVRRAVNGDTAAFEALVTPHEAMVWRTCWHYMNNTQDAQDAVQETMLKAWRSLQSWRGDASLSTWLYRIAVSCCLDLLRRRKARPGESMDALQEAGFEPTDPSPGPEASVEAYDRRQALRAALARLPEEQRIALVMTAVEGHSYEEAAAMLGVAVGTVKSRINRARSRLQEILSETWEQSGAARVKQIRRRDDR